MDFSNFKLSQQYYGGSERKIGIIISGREYMLKFQKSSPFGLRYNHISEHLGSQVFSLLGFKTQETILGTYKDELVVACKNFIGKDELFVPFNDVGESSLDQDKDRYQYEYEDIMKMLRDNSKLTHVEETIAIFWEMFIVDAFLGNFDRHGSNWGFIKKNNAYRLAPIFDNGSCLFPNMADEAEMLRIINSAEETDKRIFSFPTSQIKLQGQKSSYFEVIHSLMFPECNAALITIFNRIDLTAIFKLIDELEGVSEIHRTFYKHVIQERYTKIIKASFDLLRSQP